MGSFLKPTVDIRGFYGAGNFGDDLLMLVTYGVLRRLYSPEELNISHHGEKYISSIIGESCHISSYECPPISVQIRIWGGGGQFFSFHGTSFYAKISHYITKCIGVRPLIRIRKLRWIGKDDISKLNEENEIRIAFCIGVGPFALGSWDEIDTARKLSTFALIIVRDNESYRLIRSWKLKNRVLLASDAAFLDEYWRPQSLRPVIRTNAPKRIGVVVRHWKHAISDGKAYFEPLRHAVQALRGAGYEIHYISFNPLNDKKLLEKLSGEDVLAWLPDKVGIEEFLRAFHSFDIIVSARAHGAIVAACLGIPSVCIGIEPKLFNVHRMLLPASAIWEPPFKPEELQARIGDICANYASWQRILLDVVRQKRSESKEAAKQMLMSVTAFSAKKRNYGTD